jgi:hypothetical protein
VDIRQACGLAFGACLRGHTLAVIDLDACTEHAAIRPLRRPCSVKPRNLDGNTVDMDHERSAFAQNAVLYQLATISLDDEWKEFRMASSDPRR